MSGNVATLALVAIVPLVALTLTSFVKLSVVLSLLRNALGVPDAPTGLVVTGLSLVLTFFVMAPVVVEMVHSATAGASQAAPVASAPVAPATPVATPVRDDRSVDGALRALVPAEYTRELDAAERAATPLREFLLRHTSANDRATFVALAKQMGRDVGGDELWVVAPAFVASELREAFAIAVLIFVPFLVIDLVVALGLAALGLQATPPQVVALPLKLLLFVAVDGWRLLLESLIRGYA
jgi:type III secretion protein R